MGPCSIERGLACLPAGAAPSVHSDRSRRCSARRLWPGNSHALQWFRYRL
jgi:hypothetical protein